MNDHFHIFLSNRVERLYLDLKKNLFSENTKAFTQRIVIVPSPAMKAWLMLKMADDPELGIAAGLKISYLEPTLDELRVTLNSDVTSKKFPPIELALRIEVEIRQILSALSAMSKSKQTLWAPLFDYLQPLASRKSERRLVVLSEKLAYLFQQYEKFGMEMLRKWQKTDVGGWQEELWRKVIGEIPPEEIKWKTADLVLHVFSISFLSSKQHRFLTSISQSIPVTYYLLSPCQEFWSDILSDKESRRLQRFWHQRGASEEQQQELEEYLCDRNPLLANFGKLGRKMALQIEETHSQIHEDYDLPRRERGLLDAVQSDILNLSTPDPNAKMELGYDEDSIQVHVAKSRMREVQILYNTIMGIIDKNAEKECPICPEDVVVMAPDIIEYAPYIRAVFREKESQLHCQIMDMNMPSQNLLIQGFLHLLSLPYGLWDAASLLRLLDFPSFQKRHGLDSEDIQRIHGWTKAAGVCWGQSSAHRDEILRSQHCDRTMIDNSSTGTWEHAIERLLLGLAIIPPEEDSQRASMQLLPLSEVETTQTELLGKWISIIRSLREDLKPLSDGSRMTLGEWSCYLKCILEAYFSFTLSEDTTAEGVSALLENIDKFPDKGTLGEEKFSFTSIKYHLDAALDKQKVCYRESHLHAVRFCSLLSMRAVPAKVVVLLGMDEGAFPRKDTVNSLNLMSSNRDVDYCPTQMDFDRYLFLETILSARQYYILSYLGNSQTDGKEQPPSLLVTELLSYLDRGYTIRGNKPSDYCMKKHPFQAYDKSYFEENAVLKSYSKNHYRIAKAFYNSTKQPNHCFVPDFRIVYENTIEHDQCVDLRQLALIARNPVEAYFKRTLGIYLEREEDRHVKSEESFITSPMESSILKKNAVKTPVDLVLKLAEQEGRLPIGPFKNYSISKVRSEAEEVNNNLEKLNVDPHQVFEIEFSEHYKIPEKTVNDGWRLPPLFVQYRDTKVKIVGKFKEVASKGLIGFVKDDRKEVLKVWPQYLVFICLSRQYSLPIENQLIFAKSGKSKVSFIQDPFKQLGRYLEYYFHSLENISPLIPEWVPDLLESDINSFEKKIRTTLSERNLHFYNDYIKWVVQDSNIPNAQVIMESWKTIAEELFGDLYKNWYPRRIHN